MIILEASPPIDLHSTSTGIKPTTSGGMGSGALIEILVHSMAAIGRRGPEPDRPVSAPYPTSEIVTGPGGV
jgi:hypothetical protein